MRDPTATNVGFRHADLLICEANELLVVAITLVSVGVSDQEIRFLGFHAQPGGNFRVPCFAQRPSITWRSKIHLSFLSTFEKTVAKCRITSGSVLGTMLEYVVV